MIFLFQFLPLLFPLNQTFTCHKGSVPININDTSRILDVKVYKKGGSLLYSIEINEIITKTKQKLTKFARRRGNQESRISEYITYGEVR